MDFSTLWPTCMVIRVYTILRFTITERHGLYCESCLYLENSISYLYSETELEKLFVFGERLVLCNMVFLFDI